jgi:RNA polymerase sigma factor (sigma-70 family)
VSAFAESHNDEAFAELVRRHGSMVLATCRRVLYPDTHTADDAFQATFLVLATKARAVSPPERVGAWLHGVAVHVAKKARAWVRKITPSAPSDLDKAPANVTEPNPDAAHIRAAIDDVLAGLPAKYRSPVVLCELEGRSRADAAQALGWTEGTLSGRLARAKKLLADRLARRGFALPAAGLAAVLLAQPAAANVPAHLVASTIQAAALVAAGAATAEVTSEPVAALAREGCPPMSTTFKVLAAGIAGIGLTLGGFGLFKLYDRATAAPPAHPVVNLPLAALADEKPVKGWVTAHTFKFENPITAVAFGPDIIAAGDKEGVLRLYDAKTGKEKEVLLDGTGGAKPIDRVQFSPDGASLHLVTNEGDAVHLCSVEKVGRKFPGFGGAGKMKCFGASTDGAYWLQAFDGNKELLLMPNKLGEGMVGGQADGRFTHTDAVRYVAADDGNVVATISLNTLRVWSKDKDKPLWDAKLEKIDVTGVAVAPSGKFVAVTGDAGQVWVYDAKTGKQLSKTEKLTGPVSQAAFSPDGKRIVAACEDKTARVYDAETGKELAVLKGHTEALSCVAFSPDGETIVTGSFDKTVRVWEFKK